MFECSTRGCFGGSVQQEGAYECTARGYFGVFGKMELLSVRQDGTSKSLAKGCFRVLSKRVAPLIYAKLLPAHRCLRCTGLQHHTTIPLRPQAAPTLTDLGSAAEGVGLTAAPNGAHRSAGRS